MWDSVAVIKSIKMIEFSPANGYKVDLRAYGFTDFANIKTIPTIKELDLNVGNKGYKIDIVHEGNGIFRCDILSERITGLSTKTLNNPSSYVTTGGSSRIRVSQFMIGKSPSSMRVKTYLDGSLILDSNKFIFLSHWHGDVGFFTGTAEFDNPSKAQRTLTFGWEYDTGASRKVQITEMTSSLVRDTLSSAYVLFVEGGVV